MQIVSQSGKAGGFRSQPLKVAVSVVRFFLMLPQMRLVRLPVVSFLLADVLSNGPFIDSHCRLACHRKSYSCR